MKLKSKDLLSLYDLSLDEIWKILKTADLFKIKEISGHREPVLQGKILGMVFEKPSIRTQASFQSAMFHLGGTGFFFDRKDNPLEKEGPHAAADMAKVLSSYVQGIVSRTYFHHTTVEMARYASVPVINGRSDLEHPCQALTDLFTIYEKKGHLHGLKMAYLGEGNNVAHSLLYGAAKVGMNLTICHPEGHGILPETLEKAKALAGSNSSIQALSNPQEAVKDADILYAGDWYSGAGESEKEKRIHDFQGYILDEEKLKLTKPDCLVMHCLPAQREREITGELLEGPRSIVFDQSENRLHLQKALLALLMG